jgi:hypothetical protein
MTRWFGFSPVLLTALCAASCGTGALCILSLGIACGTELWGGVIGCGTDCCFACAGASDGLLKAGAGGTCLVGFSPALDQSCCVYLVFRRVHLKQLLHELGFANGLSSPEGTQPTDPEPKHLDCRH